MHAPASATVLVLGLLGALGAAYLASTFLAAAPPKAMASVGEGKTAPPVTPSPAGPSRPRKAGAYEVKPVEHGGTIRVFAKLSKAIDVQEFPLNKDQSGCGHTHAKSERCVFDPATLGLQGAVASLVGIESGKDFEGELAQKGRLVLFDQHKCRYEPHVLLLRAGQQVQVKNSDGVQHNVHAYFKGQTQFNEMSSSNSTLAPFDSGKLVNAGLYPVKCDIHYWMSGFIVAMKHPYHAVTGADGRCELANVPPGTYSIGCWHEGMRVTLKMNGAAIDNYEYSPDLTLPEQTVTVPADGTVDVTFTFDPK